jgi:hypothetical protein
MAQREIKTNIRHGYTGYTVKGCGCDICRAAFREYKQDYRQRQREKRAKEAQHVEQPPPEKGDWVDDVDVPAEIDYDEDPDQFEDDDSKSDEDDSANSLEDAARCALGIAVKGGVLLGVEKDLQERHVDESAPGLAALARRLAQICDNPLALPQAPGAAGRLLDIYKELGVKVNPSGSKLATVKSLIATGGDDEEQAS